ncbi:coiled-coil domain-containing protein 137 [Rhinatrema bivittatum]|uniref:coiled-coil domain-containing protein 137 n=1 Tax=Rhinatrema bivittatum TaxID=194408 RepID=UPI00112A32F5|nr:coiled-coil domain-containing protein 137 [Rhinatrema bivittatum]
MTGSEVGCVAVTLAMAAAAVVPGRRVGGGRWKGCLRQQLYSKEKKKVNAKPKNLDDQEIPFRLREIMKSRKEMNEPKRKRKVEVKSKHGPGFQSDIPVPKFKRRKWESAHAYIERMERETRHVMFLTRNQVERAPEKEQTLEEKLQKTKSQRKKNFDKKKLSKILRKKEDKKEMQLEKELFEDQVKFGEVAMQPPSFTAKPRKGVVKGKPGQKQLLLKSLLDQNSSLGMKKPATASMARQRIIEEERARVIQAYRDLKKQKQQALPQSSQPARDKLKNMD